MGAKKKDRARKIQYHEDGITRANRLADARARGAGHGMLEQSRQLHEIIDPAVLAEEPDAQDTRWIEYGYVDGFEATEVFTKMYVEAYSRLRSEFFDQEPHPCPVDPEFVRNDPGVMSALYRARQFADVMGVPYKPFIMGLSRALINKGGYRRVPLPNHLYPGPKTDKALRHGMRVRDVIMHPDRMRAFESHWDARFLAINDRDDPVQVRAREVMRQYVHGGVSPAGCLRNLLRDGFVSADQAAEIFPEQRYRSVIEEARACNGEEASPAPLPAFRPHCFGLHTAANPNCAACPWAGKCAGMVGWVEREQIAVNGSANPRAERIRADACERKRNQRARDRGKLAATEPAERKAETAVSEEVPQLTTSTAVVPTPEMPPMPLV